MGDVSQQKVLMSDGTSLSGACVQSPVQVLRHFHGRRVPLPSSFLPATAWEQGLREDWNVKVGLDAPS